MPRRSALFARENDSVEFPVSGAVFAIEQLEVHARALAATHLVGPRRRCDRLLKDLTASERILSECADSIRTKQSAGQSLTPASDWLLDNHYLVEEQILLTREHFPEGYCRGLPQLTTGDRAGLPRVYDLIVEFIAHVDGALDDEALSRYTAAYQSVVHLTLGELWAIPIMLRLALIENLSRVVTSVDRQRRHREASLEWARRIDAPSVRQEGALLVLADMVRANPPLSPAFVAQFTQALEGRGATTSLVLAWLEQRLAEGSQTLEEVIRAESQRQAADLASMANSIGSLRLVNETQWHLFVEENSRTEAILRSEPANVYAQMDVSTRDEYRHVVEAMAKRVHQDEEVVAQAAVDLAAARFAVSKTDIGAHVGYMLVDLGTHHLLRTLRGQDPKPLPSARMVRTRELLTYLGPVVLLSAGVAAWLLAHSWQAFGLAWAVLVTCSVLAASQLAVSLVNWAASLLQKPRALPRLDFEKGIPEQFRTIAVVPTMLTDEKRVLATIESLELRYLANRDSNLWFGLLTDFADAPQEKMEGDEALLNAASDGIGKLNDKYGISGHGRFFLFHRPRLFNPQEGCWMGRERKRGKLEDFNALLCGDGGTRFCRITGEQHDLGTIRYVITLDADTALPWGAGWRLVGAAAHPLNRPVMDADGRRVVCGYAILQPRISTSMRSAVQSHYSRLLAGEVGMDPYTRLVSDVYQDLFAETSFVGKGIYDVSVFRQILHGRFPDNAVLSHDLLESCYARSGQCSDVELLEDTPSGYLADVSRRHRWMRGDWQIAPWLGLRVSDATGQRIYPAIAALGRWKIFDNLRRSMVIPAYVMLFAVGWLALSSPVLWTVAVLSLAFLPEVLPGLVELWQRPRKLPRAAHLSSVWDSSVRRMAKMSLWLAFLPFEATVALDAAIRSSWRMLYSRKLMLEWQTAAAAERVARRGVGGVFLRMWVGPTLSVAIGAMLFVVGEFSAFWAAGPLLLLWFFSPVLAWWVSRPLGAVASRPSPKDILFLRHIARLTWRYFEVFVGPHENWLPPDNVQEQPDLRVAHRTSPTDMGLALLANLSAHDMGYLSSGGLLERSIRMMESMEELERYRGHFLNWYDTRTRKALTPLYVSVVDSGNLVGHLRVLRSGLMEAAVGPPLPAGLLHGLQDTQRILSSHMGKSDAMARVETLLEFVPATLMAKGQWLTLLAESVSHLTSQDDLEPQSEAKWWAVALGRQVQSLLEDLLAVAPWVTAHGVDFEGESGRRLAELDQPCSLRELGQKSKLATEALRTGVMSAATANLSADFALGAQRIDARIEAFEVAAERCLALTQADFSFLYNQKRKLFSIGYWVGERRLDNSYYDLLASESRLASYVAISSGQVPYEHWFALGRKLTTARGKQLLLSWSGSMFEYMMPLLVMPVYRGTLLDQTCGAAVSRQMEYGRQRGIPWGISESCYSVTDAEGTYQYRAFGVPGLGLQRGLADDLVVSPYASALALLIEPQQACANLRRMADDQLLGPYGFYEAIDFTPHRTSEGNEAVLVAAYMAHHHGMSLLALSQTVLGPRMQGRFLSTPEFRAAALLLQERIPKAVALVHPHPREAHATSHRIQRPVQSVLRAFSVPNTPTAEVQLLSNGRYHVMVSSVGSGYSRWQDLAVTRWRADPTSEASGVFGYVGDGLSHRWWSNSFQPALSAGMDHQALFSSGRAEFRRQDAQIETYTDIAVSSEDDLEVRRITLTNRSESTRPLILTSYAEVVLAPGLSDEVHRTFSNLFVQTELLPELSTILATRRPKNGDESPPWMFCLLLARSGADGECSFETDRSRFIGRGNSLRSPEMMQEWGPLSGTCGAVLDPCAAIRRKVVLRPGEQVKLDLILGVAPTREAAVLLATRYQDHRLADRVFGISSPYARAILAHLGASEADSQRYGQLASAMLFPKAAYRAPSGVLRRNRKGQSGLWPYALSGDLPIVLLRIAGGGDTQIVRDLLRAHAYWRNFGLYTDLVIWNEDASGYRNEVGERLQGLIAGGTEAHLIDKPGGVFLRQVDRFPEEDRVLLLTAAHLVIRDVEGPLEQQLERWQNLVPTPKAPLLVPVSSGSSASVPPVSAPWVPTSRKLVFANGIGGFTPDGKEYVVEMPQGGKTPAPWVNVIANPRFGTLVSESGSAYTWFQNAQLFRLTPWSNDPVSDPSGETLFVRDDTNGRHFNPMAPAGPACSSHTCRHGFGYSVFEHTENDLQIETTTYVSVSAPVKYTVLKIRNRASTNRSLSLFACAELVLGDLRSRNALHTETEREPLTGAILARNRFSSEFYNSVVFFDCSATPHSVTGDRCEFLGRNGNPANPDAMRLGRLSGRLGVGMDPCAAMQICLDLAPGEVRETAFIMGAGEGTLEASALVRNHRGVAVARVALEEVWRFWNEKLGVLHSETPDPALDIMLNGWLPYQVLSGRMWGRTGFYQSGGAFGFRDQLQDSLALLHEAPELCREQLLRCAEQQFVEGDVLHWWHPPGGRGVRTRCSDDFLWLPYAAARYVEFTGDTDVLLEVRPYLTGRCLEEGEESYYDRPGRSEQRGTLYEHCTRAIQLGLRFGSHGLPLMGSGDWNDGMNRVGPLGQGESVWLGFFLGHVLKKFGPLATKSSDPDFANLCSSEAALLEERVETAGWDGEWYLRAYFDNGQPLGSAQNAECRIDLLPQSWATLAGMGTPRRRKMALDSVQKQLVRPELGIVELFTPPFQNPNCDPGYVQGYPAGVRENGGQYTHAAVWAAMAFAMAGRSQQADELIKLLNPINHALDATSLQRYRTEPYVLAADIYSQPPYEGRGGWSWYTGSASWFYRLLHEVVFGLDRQGHSLRFNPRVPVSWTHFKLHYRFGRTFYHLQFEQEPSHSGPARVMDNGLILEGGVLDLLDDSKDHPIHILFGPSQPIA